MDIAILVRGVFAGNNHEVLEVWAQVAGVITTVAPFGIPLTVNVIGEGNTVPFVGRMSTV